MRPLRRSRVVRARRLLLAPAETTAEATWGHEIETFLTPTGVVVYRARSCDDAVRRIEEGGLSAAVLMQHQPAPDGVDVFSLLRIIRSIDAVLPCWLVTRVMTRRSLERALDLRVQSMIQYPAGVEDLLAGLRKVFSDPSSEN